MASIERLEWPANGRPGSVIFANPASTSGRVNLTIRASADDVIGVSIMRRRSARGRWRAVEDGFAWIPANSEDIARIVPTTHEAVRETLLMVLISLQVKRRPPADAMKTAEAILPNPATRVA